VPVILPDTLTVFESIVPAGVYETDVVADTVLTLCVCAAVKLNVLCDNVAAVPVKDAATFVTFIYEAVTLLVILGDIVLNVPAGVYEDDVEVGVVEIPCECDAVKLYVCDNVAAVPWKVGCVAVAETLVTYVNDAKLSDTLVSF